MQLKTKNAQLARERDHYCDLYQQTIEQCRKLELGILGQKFERLVGDNAQLTMAVLATMLGQSAVAPPTIEKETVREHTRAKPTGRKPLPENLPRVDIEVLPDDVQRAGLDAFERIGEDVPSPSNAGPARWWWCACASPNSSAKIANATPRPRCCRRHRRSCQSSGAWQVPAFSPTRS